MSEFIYSPLTGHDSFRLILLQPSSSHSSPLHCTLLHTTLSQCSLDIIEPFTALSYVWGSPLQTGQITIGDHQPVNITASLASALRDLRDPTRVLRVWADALCIDQSNSAERSQQVSLMGDIYSTANHTIIHILPASTEHEVVLRSLKPNTFGIVSSQHLSTDELISIADSSLLTAPWFVRVWTFQELVLSSDPWIQCGGIRARWTDLCGLLLFTPPSHSKVHLSQSSPRVQLLSSINATRGPHRLTLLRHLSNRRGLGATQPVDMIYSHLGVISDLAALREYMQISYDVPCAVVYEQVARYMFEKGVGPGGAGSFFIHLSANHRSEMHDLASWAPDWSLPDEGLASMYSDTVISTLLLESEGFFAFTERWKPMVLGWVGYEIDTVRDLSLEFPDPNVIEGENKNSVQQVGGELAALYRAAGVHWSGDEYGRYRHVSLRGREEEHKRLAERLATSWCALLRDDLPKLHSTSQPPSFREDRTEDDTDEAQSAHQAFLPTFSTFWPSKNRSPSSDSSTAPSNEKREPTILVGSNSSGLPSLLYNYLFPDSTQRPVLQSRRLASTASGKIAVVPTHARPGDQIVYLAGREIALVLRFPGSVPTSERAVDESTLPRDESYAGQGEVEEVEREFKSLLKQYSALHPQQSSRAVIKREELLGNVDGLRYIPRGKIIGDAYVDGEVAWRRSEWLAGKSGGREEGRRRGREVVLFGLR